MSSSNTIHFYSHNIGKYQCFSNFSSHPVTINGKIYPTTEHYFQAQKFPDYPNYMEAIRTSHTPYMAKKLGSTRNYKLRDDWEEVKEQVMEKCLYAKFTQHENIKNILLTTGDKILVEHTPYDKYWGDGLDGSGKNRLGILLMELREKLRES